MCEFGRQEQGTDSSGVCGLVALAAQQALEVRIIPPIFQLLISLPTGYWVILHDFLLSAVFFKINFFEKFFQEFHQRVK